MNRGKNWLALNPLWLRPYATWLSPAATSWGAEPHITLIEIIPLRFDIYKPKCESKHWSPCNRSLAGWAALQIQAWKGHGPQDPHVHARDWGQENIEPVHCSLAELQSLDEDPTPDHWQDGAQKEQRPDCRSTVGKPIGSGDFFCLVLSPKAGSPDHTTSSSSKEWNTQWNIQPPPLPWYGRFPDQVCNSSPPEGPVSTLRGAWVPRSIKLRRRCPRWKKTRMGQPPAAHCHAARV